MSVFFSCRPAQPDFLHRANKHHTWPRACVCLGSSKQRGDLQLQKHPFEGETDSGKFGSNVTLFKSLHKTEPKHGIDAAHYDLLAVGSWQAENFSLFSASAVRLFLPSYLAAMQPPLSHKRNAHSTVFVSNRNRVANARKAWQLSSQFC